jgi:hypothetical protein
MACEVTSVLVPDPGSVMAEWTGGPVMSEPDTAKTCTTNGAGLVRWTVSVCAALVDGALT